MSLKLSKAPDSPSDSIVFLLQERVSILSKKLKVFLKNPFCSRSLIMATDGPSPTPFIPANPKRIQPSLVTEKFNSDSLISGPFNGMLSCLHSVMNLVISLISSLLRVKFAAIYSAG